MLGVWGSGLRLGFLKRGFEGLGFVSEGWGLGDGLCFGATHHCI